MLWPLASNAAPPAVPISAAAVPASQSMSSPVAAPKDAPAEPPHPPFPLAEAATQAESASITLRSIETLVNSDRTIASIKDETPILTTEIDSRMDETSKLLTSNPSLQLLGEQEQDWAAIQRTLDEWKKQLQGRRDQLDQSRDEIKHLDFNWKQEQELGLDYWFKHTDQPELLETAQDSVESTRSLIEQTRDDLKSSSIELFTIQQDVDGQAARVLDVLYSVRQARDEAFSRLLAKNDPPIWNGSSASQGQGNVLQQGQQSLLRQLKAVIAYMRRRQQNVFAQAMLLVLLNATLYFIRHRAGIWAKEEPELTSAMKVFASPIATAIVLTLLLSASFYPQAPRLFWAAVEAAALIPTVLILRELIDRRWFSMLDALVVFYFLDQLRSIAAVVPLVARVLLLVEMAGASALVVLFIRASRTNAVTGRIGRIIRFASWFWLVIFSLALLADVIGYTSLANLLGDAALGSSYLAVILYAFTRIVTGLIVIALHSRPLVLLKMVREHQWLFQRRLNLMVAWIAVAGWALGVLASLSVASAAYEMVRKDLSRGFYLGQIPVTPGHILAFLVAIWASVQVSRFLRFVLEEDVYDRLHISGGISYAVSKMLNYVVLLVGFFFAVSALGYDMTNFTILASAFGVGLGFGMQNIVNNFVSGLILLFERPIKVGDVIQMDDTTGVVAHIGIRASIIRTLNSAEIIVPNGNLISGKVTNWTLSNRQRGLEIPINVGPGTDPARVMQLLVTVARAQPMIIKSPPPEVFLTAFSADAFSYQLHAWTNAADQWIQIRSDLSIAIHDALVKEQIPFK